MESRLIIPIILSILLISLVSSISCTPTNINVNGNQSSSISPTSVTCTNSDNTPISCWFNSIAFTTTPSPLTLNNNSDTTFSVNYNTQSLGSFNDYLVCAGNPVGLNTHLEVTQNQPTQNPNSCNIGSSLSALTQAVEQNSVYSLPKITFDPINCNQGNLILDSSHVRVTGGIILGGIQKPLSISSLVSDGVNLAIDTRNLNIQPYSSNLEINAFGKTFQIPITIVVTNGASDSTVFDCSQIPTCTITNSIMSLNNSNSLVCTSIPSGLKIIPIVDSTYIIGTNVQTTNTQYIWYFKGVKNGITKVKASFTYLDAPVCQGFSQDISIQSSGVVTGTNTLKLLFTPDLSLVKPSQDVIIQIAETGSNSLIPNAQLLIDAVNINSSDSYTFHTSFISGKNYSLRVLSTGYADLTYILNLNYNPISINITPSSGDSDTQFAINTIPENTSIFLDGNKINNPFYSTISPGSHELRAIREGYLDGVLNMTVQPAVFLTSSGEFKKGVLQVFTLNKNSTCQVNYIKDVNSISEIIIPPQINIDKIQFTPSKSGTYIITCNGVQKYSQTITGFNWSFKIWFMAWYWWAVGIIVIIFIIARLRKNKQSLSLSTPIES